MLRRALVPLVALLLVSGLAVNAQNRVDDPPDQSEVLEEMLKAPYYSGAGRSQRPIVDRVPEQILSGTGFRYTNVRYFRGVGTILTDLDDRTLYATEQDREFGKSSLDAEALKDWEPILVTEGANFTGLWGKAWNESLKAWVLTLVDKPLYRYTGDEAPGDAKGLRNGWYTLEVIS